jgi:hypothetical protein
MKWRNLVLGIVTLALTACVGDLSGPGGGTNPGVDAGTVTPTPDADTPGGGNARLEFEANIAPLLQASCADAECHTGPGTSPLKFLGVNNTPSTYYDTLEIYDSVHGGWNPAVATLLTKITAGHQGITYTPEQSGAITTWLNNEKALRDIDPPDVPGGPKTTKQALEEWAGCMNLADWQATTMGDWSNRGTNEGPCSNCHNDGAFRFHANANDTDMFGYNRLEVFIQGFFSIAVDPATGNASIVPDHDKLERMSNGGGAGGLHPLYNYSPDDSYYQRLQDFYDATEQKRTSLLCGTPGFPPPPAP